MDTDRKKIAAASAAVIRYLEAEREQREAPSVSAAAGPGIEGATAVTPAGAFWTASGRLAAMQFRNLMQLRMLRKA